MSHMGQSGVELVASQQLSAASERVLEVSSGAGTN